MNGSTPTDTKGNVYAEDGVEGVCHIYSAPVTVAMVNGVDEITVSGATLWRALVVENVNLLYPVDSVVTAAGTVTGDPAGVDTTTGTYTDTVSKTLRVFAGAMTTTYVPLYWLSSVQVSESGWDPGFPAGESYDTDFAAAWVMWLEYIQSSVAETGDVEIHAAGAGDYDVVVVTYAAVDDARKISFDRRRDTLTVLAHVKDDTSLRVTRYDDTEAVVATVTVVSSGATSCSLFVTRDDVLRLFFTADDAFKRVESRDGGRTWGSVTTIASGYDACTVARDPASGFFVAGLYVASTATWYVTVSDVSTLGIWSTPTIIATSATGSGEMRRRADGVWEFAYVNSSDAAVIIRSRSVSHTNNGTWA